MFATSIAISLADIVEARFPVSYSHVLICSDFKEAFETGEVSSYQLSKAKMSLTVTSAKTLLFLRNCCYFVR